MHTAPLTGHKSVKHLLALCLGALGVVYGDIGTSPLYAVNEMFFGHHRLALDQSTILGVTSLVFWALTIIIAIKYIVFVLSADNDGEGGIFALVGLLTKSHLKNIYRFIIPILILAAGLLYGDGMITPAISIISAVEGLKVATPVLEPFIVPITLVILTGLFSIQKHGTHKIGRLFGPIIIAWFLAIGTIGINQILQFPEIIKALNPLQALNFMANHAFLPILFTFGSLMLVVTGGEAMYADMGHFGAKPIRLSWFSLVYPALLLNYFGQGAYLLSGQAVLNNNIFYSLVPSVLLYPMVVLATLATIIASQAVISGAFSLTAQAVNLGLIPRLKISHTNEAHEGQKYINLVNWAIFAGSFLLVITFRSSSNLAATYGLAVSGDMFMTSLAMIGISHYLWRWSRKKSLLVFLPLLALEGFFLSANSLKILSGGYVPLSIALIMGTVMLVWKWGRELSRRFVLNYPTMTVKDLVKLKQKQVSFIPRPFIYIAAKKIDEITDTIPVLKQIFWERYQIMPKHMIFVRVLVDHQRPFIHHDRYQVYKFYEDKKKGSIQSVVIHFGFMEQINLKHYLVKLAGHHQINIDTHPNHWLVHMANSVLFKPHRLRLNLFQSLRLQLYGFLKNNSASIDQFYGLGRKIKLTLEYVQVPVK